MGRGLDSSAVVDSELREVGLVRKEVRTLYLIMDLSLLYNWRNDS